MLHLDIVSIFRKPLSHVHHFLRQGQVGHVRRTRVVVVRVLRVALRLLGSVALVGAAKVRISVLNVPAQSN